MIEQTCPHCGKTNRVAGVSEGGNLGKAAPALLWCGWCGGRFQPTPPAPAPANPFRETRGDAGT